MNARGALRLAVPAALAVIVSLIAWRLGYFEAGRRDELIAAVGEVRGSMRAAAVYVLVYTLAVLLCLPATVLMVIGGALFGTMRGALYTWLAAMAGTLLAHALARTFSSRAIQRIFGRHRLLDRLRGTVDVPLLVRLRVLPLAPFGVLDYVAGLAGVPLRTLLIATAVAIIPGTLAYSFAGSQLRVGLESPEGAGHGAFVLAGAISLVMTGTAALPWLIRKLRARKD